MCMYNKSKSELGLLGILRCVTVYCVQYKAKPTAKKAAKVMRSRLLVVKLTLLVWATLTCFVAVTGAFQSLLPYNPPPKQLTHDDKHIPTSLVAAGWKHPTTKPWIIHHAATTTTVILHAAKNNNNNKNNQDNDTTSSSFLHMIQEMPPGTLIAAPFVILVGLDLVANIFFITKRTIEYFVFGKLPSTEVWFSDNFFFTSNNNGIF